MTPPPSGKLFKVCAWTVGVLTITLISLTVLHDHDRSVRDDERQKVLQDLQSRSLVPQCPKFGYGKKLQVGRGEWSGSDGKLSCYYSDSPLTADPARSR